MITYSLAKAGFVTLKVYDLLGNEVRNLVNEFKDKGRHEVLFNGSKLTSGIYLYRLESGNYSEAKKLILMK
jgi:5-hydroxyisourate hydrolase-like protein (transthyretin family)